MHFIVIFHDYERVPVAQDFNEVRIRSVVGEADHWRTAFKSAIPACKGKRKFVCKRLCVLAEHLIEGDERFSVVQFKFREIILSELGEIGNIGFE